MSSITDTPTAREAKTTGKARSRLKKAVAKTRRITRKIAENVPTETKRGFNDGRQAGNNVVEAIPYVAGAVVGFTVGATEAIVGALVEPVGNLLGWASSLVCGE